MCPLGVVVTFDKKRAEPLFEEMAAATVARVERLRVTAVEELHAEGQIVLPRLRQQVVVVGHEAVDATEPCELGGGQAQEGDEEPAIAIVTIERCAFYAATRDMKEAVSELCSRSSRHVAPIPNRASGSRAVALFRR